MQGLLFTGPTEAIASGSGVARDIAPKIGIQPSEGLWQAGGTAFVWSITTWNHLEPPRGRMGGFSKQGSVER